MPISSIRPDIKKHLKDVELTNDAAEGDKDDFVRPLSGQSIENYRAYIERAAYFNVVDRTVSALTGALLRKPYKLDNVEFDSDFTSFNEVLQTAYRNILLGSRTGIYVDYSDESQTAKLYLYSTEQIINYSDNFIILEECILLPSAKDEYEIEEVRQYRELRLDDGVYSVRVHREVSQNRYELVSGTIPAIRGLALDFIPFWFCNQNDNSRSLYKPPLFSLAELNIQHFKLSVDLAHGLHYTALPQPYLSGDVVTSGVTSAVNLAIGTDRVWHLTQGSTVAYLEFSGAGLGMIKTQLEHIEDQMYSAGSRLITTKRGVESAEALVLRAGSESAVLVNIAASLEQALKEAAVVVNMWNGTIGEPTVELNKDFTASVLDPNEIKVLFELYQNNVITLDTLHNRLYAGEVISDVNKEKVALSTQNAVK